MTDLYIYNFVGRMVNRFKEFKQIEFGFQISFTVYWVFEKYKRQNLDFFSKKAPSINGTKSYYLHLRSLF